MTAATNAQSRGSCLESYRVDVTSSAWPILIPAAFLTMLGVLGIGAAFINHGPLAHNTVITFIGSACMLAGPLTAIVGMRQLLADDEYVAALENGLLVFVNKEERFVAWGDIERVHWDAAAQAIEITATAGAPIVLARPFAPTTGADLALRLDDLRRKAVFHLSLAPGA